MRALFLLIALLLAAATATAADTSADTSADTKQEEQEAIETLLKNFGATDGNIEKLLTLRYAVNDAIANAVLAGMDDTALPALTSATSGADADTSATAPITLYEFSDYQCGYCRRMFPLLSQAVDDGKIKLALIELPVLGPLSDEAARTALAAQQQGKFDAFHRALMQSGRLSESKIADAVEAAQLDEAAVEDYINSPAADAHLERNYKLAILLNITGTPGFIINGQVLRGAFDEDSFKRLLEEEQ